MGERLRGRVLDRQSPTSASCPCRWTMDSGRQSGSEVGSSTPLHSTASNAHTISTTTACHQHDQTAPYATPPLHLCATAAPPHRIPTGRHGCTACRLQGEWAQEGGALCTLGGRLGCAGIKDCIH